MQNQKLISILDKELYPLLWKSSHTELFLIDFLNAYFGFTGENRIDKIFIIPAKEFTKDSDIKRRIHIYFIIQNIKYYYEIKFSKKLEDTNDFDFSFLSFKKYCLEKEFVLENVKIGQIILNFNKKIFDMPIINYGFNNENLKISGKKLDIHVLNLYTINHILNTKSLLELNLFERWIRLLLCDMVCDAKRICLDYHSLNHFLKIWSYHSKRIEYKRLSLSSSDTLDYLLEKKSLEVKYKIATSLLQAGHDIFSVSEMTDLEIKIVLELKESLDNAELEKCGG